MEKEIEFEGHPDEYIKGTVRIHHASWIIGPLDEILEWATKGEMK